MLETVSESKIECEVCRLDLYLLGSHFVDNCMLTRSTSFRSSIFEGTSTCGHLSGPAFRLFVLQNIETSLIHAEPCLDVPVSRVYLVDFEVASSTERI